MWGEWEELGGRRCGSVSSVSWALQHPGHNWTPIGWQSGIGNPIVNAVNFNDHDLRLAGGRIPGGDTNKSPCY